MSRKNLAVFSFLAIGVAMAVGLHAQTTHPSTYRGDAQSTAERNSIPHFIDSQKLRRFTHVVDPDNISTFTPVWQEGPLPDQLVIRDKALANQTRELVKAYGTTQESSERSELAEQLKDMLTEHFDVKQQLREMRLIALEERVKRLREDHDRRTAAKSKIIEKRFDHLIDEVEGLGWTPGAPVELSSGPNAPDDFGGRASRGGFGPPVDEKKGGFGPPVDGPVASE